MQQLAFHRDTDALSAVEHMPLCKHVDQLCLIMLSDGNTSHLGAAYVKGWSNAVDHSSRPVLNRTNALSDANQVAETGSIAETSRTS